MNIRDIISESTVARNKSPMLKKSFLDIGKKGQVISGTVSSVGDKISINFNGVEVCVSSSSVQNAREGDVRNYRIMDVSKENIVLKEVGNESASDTVRSRMGTTVSQSSRSFSDCLSDARMTSQSEHDAGESLTVVTGEDCQDMESECGDLEKYKKSALDRAIKRTKENRKQQKEQLKNYQDACEEKEETNQKMQIASRLDRQGKLAVKQILEQSDLPATQENISRVQAALQMSEAAGEMSDSTKVYLIENMLPPTIENIYHGMYSGCGGISSSSVDETVWSTLESQVKELLLQNSMDTQENLEQAKWLFANDLPIQPSSIALLNTLQEIQENANVQTSMRQIIQAMSEGAAPEKAVLDNSQIVIAQQVISDFSNISDEAVKRAVRATDNGESPQEITLALIKKVSIGIENHTVNTTDNANENDDTASQNRYFMTQRQLVEIRMKMTMQAAVRLMGGGMKLETTPLSGIVNGLRQMDAEYYQDIAEASDVSEASMQLFQETLVKTEDIRRAPASVLAVSLKQTQLLTMNVLHRTAVSETVRQMQYQKDYEAVGTQIRGDLGDTIKKAFGNIPQLLSEIGLEDTQSNERAVRILGYNQLEISEKNINAVKQQDARVNSIIQSMRPSSVLEMIRRGQNPLEMSLDALEQNLKEIHEEQDLDSTEKYSRYLWRLEQDDAISAQERDAYIGIYRMLNQIEKTDGAVIGAVLDAGKEMNFSNLLSEVRRWNGAAVDHKVDDEFGGLEALTSLNHSISEQIYSGFRGTSQQEMQQGQQSPEDREEKHYYSRMSEQILDEITPSTVRQITEGDWNKLFGMTLEQFQEQMQKTSPNKEIEDRLYEQLAQEIRDTEQMTQGTEFLQQLGMEQTIANVQSAERLVAQGLDVNKEIYKKKDVLSEQENQEYDDVLDDVLDSMGDREQLQKACEKWNQYSSKILSKQIETDEVAAKDFQQMRSIRQNIELQKQLVHKYSYDIPIKTGESITSVNVTMVSGTSEQGKVQIFMNAKTDQIPEEEKTPLEQLGGITVELRVRQEEIKGIILCDRREGYDLLSQKEQELKEQLQKGGFAVKNLSCSMDYRERQNLIQESGQGQEPAMRLYQAAKIIVTYMAQIAE